VSPDGSLAVTHSPAAQRIIRAIERGGPVPVGLFMAWANAHYYATRDPLGADGDFTTSPEISQMFGELIGLWAADLMARAGGPLPVWVELGPGRGTLTADALRAMRRFGFAPAVHFVETSPVLRDLQAAAVPGAIFHDDVTRLPQGPAIIVANEFFDALPIRQLVMMPAGWRERLVSLAEGRFVPVAGDAPMDAAVPLQLRAAPPGTILETSPASVAIMRDCAGRIAAHGGAMLVIDYGHERSGHGDTLQAVERHGYADVFDGVGDRDLTAHVDFAALAEAALGAGASMFGPVGQGAFLGALGIDARAESLAARQPDRRDDIMAARHRLVASDAMGDLFRVLAITAPGWPRPEGFGA
jgi:NADH dehydrogenase [ubiquinone] 1 alpha subcomplex assembly factor 7